MQTIFIVLLLVLIGVVVWFDRRRERILKAATLECENIARTYWSERAAADRQRDALINAATRGLEQLLEAAKKREFEAAMVSTRLKPDPVEQRGFPAAHMFDRSGIYREFQGGPLAKSEFQWGTKTIDPRAVGAGLRSDRLLTEIETAADQQRIFQQQIFADAMLMGVGASRTHYDSGTVRTEHVPAAAFMGGAGGSFDGGGVSGDYDRSASPASTSSASDSSSSSYSAPSSSDSSSSSCSSSDSGGSSSSSSD